MSYKSSSRKFDENDVNLFSNSSLRDGPEILHWDFARYLPREDGLRLKVEEALEAGLHFAIKVLFYAHKEPRCNFVVSSLSTAVSMASLIIGSYGQTQTELLDAFLGNSDVSNSTMSVFKSQMQLFLKNIILPNTDICFETVLYMSQDIVPEPTFISNLKCVLNVDVRQFVSRQSINKDFLTATRGKIKQVLLNVDKSPQLLLVNAFHFKPRWAINFSNQLSAPFIINKNWSVDICFMEAKATLNSAYNSVLNFTVVEIPLLLCEYTLLIYLPGEGGCFEYLFLESDACLCETLTTTANKSQMTSKPTRVQLPKLVLEHTRHFRNFLPTVRVDEALSSGRATFQASCTNYCHTTVALTDMVIKTVLDWTDTDFVENPKYGMVETDSVMDIIVNRPFFFAVTSPLDSERRLFLTFGYIRNPIECGATSMTLPEL